MISWRITNTLPTSLTVADLNITLQARGGIDSSIVITDDSYQRSSSLQQLISKKWIIARNQYVQAAVQSSPPPVRTVPSLPPVVPVPVTVPADVSFIKEEIQSLGNRMDLLLKLIKNQPPPTVVVQHVSGGVSPGPVASYQTPEELILPSSIRPDNVIDHLKVHREESSTEDFDEAASALKKLRKASKV